MVKKVLRLLLIIVIIVVLVVVGKIVVNRKKGQLAKAPKYGTQPVTVRIVTARKGDIKETIDYLAVVEPFQTAQVSSRLVSTIENILCDEGDRVKAGQVLLKLDSREIKDDIAGVQARIEQARAEKQANDATVQSLVKTAAYWDRQARRDKSLADKGSIPPAQAETTADKASGSNGQLDATRAKSKALEHSITSLIKKKDQLTTKLSYCVITSPYDGIVRSRLVDPGDMASPGKVLLVVEDRSRLKLVFDVPQKDLPGVHDNLPVVFSIGKDNRQAELSHLFPSLNEARMLRAEVYLTAQQKANLTCGEYVPLSVVTKTFKNVVIVQRSSLIENPQTKKQHVFIVQDGKMTDKAVKVMANSGDMVAIEGIEAGSEVVTSTFMGWARLASGQKVEVLR